MYVVHGIGEQQDTETAVALRWGIEDTLPKMELRRWFSSPWEHWILPAPYINDGHWADYSDLEAFTEDIGADLEALTARQRAFFSTMWEARTKGWLRSLWWVVSQGLKLIRTVPWRKKPVYILLTILLAILMSGAAVWPRTRRFLVAYVNDARLYMEPRGDIECEIVQLIDRRVARRFLKMIGVDMEFRKLGTYDGPLVDGQPHPFKSVVWVAHSLGTVISFNVIGDLLRKCLEIREKYESYKNTAASSELEESLECALRVEAALSRFITIGSPLDKVAFLYSGKRDPTRSSVLRNWPGEYMPGGPLDIRVRKDRQDMSLGQSGVPEDADMDRYWWTSIFYGSDPVSGPLDTINCILGLQPNKEYIRNISTLGLRVPIASHVRYWSDTGVIANIISGLYGDYSKAVRYGSHKSYADRDRGILFIYSWPRKVHKILSGTGLLSVTAVIFLLMFLLVRCWDRVEPWFVRLVS